VPEKPKDNITLRTTREGNRVYISVRALKKARRRMEEEAKARKERIRKDDERKERIRKEAARAQARRRQERKRPPASKAEGNRRQRIDAAMRRGRSG